MQWLLPNKLLCCCCSRRRRHCRRRRCRRASHLFCIVAEAVYLIGMLCSRIGDELNKHLIAIDAFDREIAM